MKLGFIGLGRMGNNLVLHLLEKKHEVVVYDLRPELIAALTKPGAIPAKNVPELIQKLLPPRVVWIMIPSQYAEELIETILPLLSPGDTLIDGGNSYFEDSIRRASMLQKKGIHFLDCGTSGGIEGARHGAALMIGGEKEIFEKVEYLFKDLSVKEGYGYVGSSGAGHFVKMVHNGIEYGMMGAIAEGMQSIAEAPFQSDLKTVAQIYARGSIIQSRLMDWLLDVYAQQNYLETISGEVPFGETESEMEKLEKISDMPVLHAARMMRIKTRSIPSYKGKLIAALRNQFGGHQIKKNKL